TLEARGRDDPLAAKMSHPLFLGLVGAPYTELDRMAQQHINKSLCLCEPRIRLTTAPHHIRQLGQMIVFILLCSNGVF
ncbi:MAG: hypothetical protein J0H36_04300, partial [Hyphomicrobium denitrificans]|nr:hypothetical protein [Hyphomicrobium denitrificans]